MCCWPDEMASGAGFGPQTIVLETTGLNEYCCKIAEKKLLTF